MFSTLGLLNWDIMIARHASFEIVDMEYNTHGGKTLKGDIKYNLIYIPLKFHAKLNDAGNSVPLLYK